MKNQFLVMEKLKDSLRGLDEATKNAEADRAALIMRIDELESALIRQECYIDGLSQKIDQLRSDLDTLSSFVVSHLPRCM